MSAQTTSPQASKSIFAHSKPPPARDLIEEAFRRGHELDRSGELCDRPHPRMRTRPQPPQSARSRSETISRKRQRENTGSWIGAAHSCRASLGHLRLKPADPRRNDYGWRFSPSASGPNSSRGKIAALRRPPLIAPARSRLTSAGAARRLLSAATRGTDGMSRRPEEAERRNEHP
jgi:hypothetical protein